MPTIEGTKYTWKNLREITGWSTHAIRTRLIANPNISLDELRRKKNPHEMIEVDGKTHTIYEWAKMNNMCDDTVRYRWKKGVRDPYELVNPRFMRGMTSTYSLKNVVPCEIDEDTIRYLCETKWARSGQPDEWEIACDLAGVEHKHAGYIKKLIERRTPA